MPAWVKQMEQRLGKDRSVYDEFRWFVQSIPLSSPGREILLGKVDELEEFNASDDPTVEDGFGSTWSMRCPTCEALSIEVVRPGKVQCRNCG